MRKPLSLRILAVVITLLIGLAPHTLAAQALDPIVYNLKFPAAEKNLADVEAIVPTGGRASVDMMMAIWSPGYYKVENYAAKVQGLSARTTDGQPLKVEQPQKNRWRIETGGAPKLVLSYKVLCTNRGVSGCYVGTDAMVLNGGPIFITLVEKEKRPHDVFLELAPKWKSSRSGLEPAPDGKPNHYRAPDFDAIMDCPIVAGNLAVDEFEVDGSKHFVVATGDTTQWDGKKAASELKKIVEENRRMWGFLPFKRYEFLFSLKGGGGGIEHSNSALMGTTAAATRGQNITWLMFVSHEYFHAFNVKRLRPVELGPFDYEKEPRTTGLWVSEGLTSYFGDLIVARAGLATPKEYLNRLSSNIEKLQKSPGRLVQTLDQSSLDVWTQGMMGGAKGISYYTKGLVVGFVLEGKIQKATNGAKSMDDFIKLAYKRYGGEKGFTADQLRETAEEVAGIDLKEPFRKWLSTTDELDYTESLDWFGLRFGAAEKGGGQSWRLEVREDATEAQKARLDAWVGKRSV
jgi:predicted metalloprotease with PDZ domain